MPGGSRVFTVNLLVITALALPDVGLQAGRPPGAVRPRQWTSVRGMAPLGGGGLRLTRRRLTNARQASLRRRLHPPNRVNPRHAPPRGCARAWTDLLGTSGPGGNASIRHEKGPPVASASKTRAGCSSPVALRAGLRPVSVPTCPVVCLAGGPPLARRRGQARVTSGNPFPQPAPVALRRGTRQAPRRGSPTPRPTAEPAPPPVHSSSHPGRSGRPVRR